MPYFGDIFVPWITETDTSITKNTVEKNFVDEAPEVFEITTNLESGSYSLIFNEDQHPRQESFTEQKDAVRSMPTRHGTEFPVEFAGNKGYVVVNGSTVNTTPSEEIQEGEINILFLDEEDYKAAFKVRSFSAKDPFDTPDPDSDYQGILALPQEAQNVTSDFGISPDFSIEGEDGVMGFYDYERFQQTISYDPPSDDFTALPRINPCRITDSSGNRVYSDKAIQSGSVISNGVARVERTISDNFAFEFYHGGDWILIDELVDDIFNSEYGYASINENMEVVVDWTEQVSVRMLRGHPMFELQLTGSFVEKPESNFISFFYGDTLIDENVGDDENQYIVVEDNDTGLQAFITAFNDINLSWNDGEFTISGRFDEDVDYSFHIGIIPPEVNYLTYIDRLYNLGSYQKTFVEK